MLVGVAIERNLLFADSLGEWVCGIERGKDACLTDGEYTVTGDLLNSMCFVDRGGSGGRGPSDWLRYASPDAVEAGSGSEFLVLGVAIHPSAHPG